MVLRVLNSIFCKAAFCAVVTISAGDNVLIISFLYLGAKITDFISVRFMELYKMEVIYWENYFFNC